MGFDYVTAFRQGGHWSKYVADILQSKGVRCSAPEIKIATTTAEREYMTRHEQDIIFDWNDEALEVKSSSRDFTSDCFNYPYQSLFVDTVSSFESKIVKPLAYVFVSQKVKGLVCLSPKAKNHWRKVEAFDKQRQINELFYSASKDLLIPFDDLVDHLLKHQNMKDDGSS